MAFSLKKQADSPDPEPEVAESAEIRGKGRPTPKRREVVGVRGPVTAPKTRKEAYARQKAQTKAVRAAGRTTGGTTGKAMTPAERRAALRSGEVLTRRDQGEARALARDFVDSRRMLSNWLLLLFPLMIASYFIKTAVVQLVVMAFFLVIIGEWIITGRRIHKLAVERFGSADASALSLGFYAGSRAYLPRRWRMPAPKVELGDPV
jgi:hypothetical protein